MLDWSQIIFIGSKVTVAIIHEVLQQKLKTSHRESWYIGNSAQE